MNLKIFEYLELLEKSIRVRLEGNCQDEDYYLEELDLLWYKLDQEEITTINTLITKAFMESKSFTSERFNSQQNPVTTDTLTAPRSVIKFPNLLYGMGPTTVTLTTYNSLEDQLAISFEDGERTLVPMTAEELELWKEFKKRDVKTL